MRILFFAICAMALAWSGYWIVGAISLERTLIDWLEQRRLDGWVAEASSVNTRGFPNRFDSTFSDLELADPSTGMAWTAPFFQIFSLSYRPNHIIAVLPERHQFRTPEQTIEF